MNTTTSITKNSATYRLFEAARKAIRFSEDFMGRPASLTWIRTSIRATDPDLASLASSNMGLDWRLRRGDFIITHKGNGTFVAEACNDRTDWIEDKSGEAFCLDLNHMTILMREEDGRHCDLACWSEDLQGLAEGARERWEIDGLYSGDTMQALIAQIQELMALDTINTAHQG